MLGTDATLIDPSVALGAIEAADLDATEREAVMGANAVDLFGL
jgi:predicted TIM-barrel fold metal-dependent hydrolase